MFDLLAAGDSAAIQMTPLLRGFSIATRKPHRSTTTQWLSPKTTTQING